MASNFDAEEFVDEDFRSGPASPGSGTTPTASSPHSMAASPASGSPKAPSREEVEERVNAMQQKISSLKQAQQDLERERATLDDLRRRQAEFAHGRQEMTHHLTRGVGLLEDAELEAKRNVELLSKTLAEFRDALGKIQAINEESWTKSTLEVELTRANTVIENARMEWNSALVKLPQLSADPTPDPSKQTAPSNTHTLSLLRQLNYAELCKLGLALTWPLVLAGLGIFLVLLIR